MFSPILITNTIFDLWLMFYDHEDCYLEEWTRESWSPERNECWVHLLSSTYGKWVSSNTFPAKRTWGSTPDSIVSRILCLDTTRCRLPSPAKSRGIELNSMVLLYTPRNWWYSSVVSFNLTAKPGTIEPVYGLSLLSLQYLLFRYWCSTGHG